MTEIKPCPWCDETNASVKFGVNWPLQGKNVLAEGYYIDCNTEDCNAGTLYQETEDMARKAWNAHDVWGYDI